MVHHTFPPEEGAIMTCGLSQKLQVMNKTQKYVRMTSSNCCKPMRPYIAYKYISIGVLIYIHVIHTCCCVQLFCYESRFRGISFW